MELKVTLLKLQVGNNPLLTARSHVLVVHSEPVQPVRMRKLVKQVNELACLWETRAIISFA